MQAWLIAEDFAYHTATWKIVAGSTPLAMSMVKALWRMKFPHTARCNKWEFPLSLQKGWQILLQVFIPYTQLGFPSLGTALQAQTTLRSLSCRSRIHIPPFPGALGWKTPWGWAEWEHLHSPAFGLVAADKKRFLRVGFPLTCTAWGAGVIWVAVFLQHSF